MPDTKCGGCPAPNYMLFQMSSNCFSHRTVFKYLAIQGCKISKGSLVPKALLPRRKSGITRKTWLLSRPARPEHRVRRPEEGRVWSRPWVRGFKVGLQ